jgi:hypothetical protein|tara:strand:- start:7789 stop:7977 length:189 start_codon:yes stop_codon:yes gene_type:complete
MNPNQMTQDSFMMIERLAALCATPGVDANTQEIANSQIQAILNSVIKPAVTKLSAQGAGILV